MVDVGEEEVLLRVHRSGSGWKLGRLVPYRVPWREGMTVLDGLVHVQENQEPGLAFRRNCGAGRCGSCGAEVDGRPVLTCSTRLPRGGDVTVEPMRTFPVIRDLVVDLSGQWVTAGRVPLFEAVDDGDDFWRIPREDVSDVAEFRRCIECFLCQDVCHVLREHGQDFVGPRFVTLLASLDMHPRDAGDRSGFSAESGLELCNVTRCCQETCPEEIRITDEAIIPEKERLISRKDPVARLLKRVLGR
ncbi:MAG: Fumarate reductase (CoM/CoB) subunit B [Methanonatronarchaeales archaeon]|nr:Fumarate reductase (CoM/CoB) subunit B [Methanonatronarchaeales archaeon]